MFKCGNCSELTQPREPKRMVVVHTRPRTYENGFDDTELPLVSKGTEVVKEIGICPACVTILGLDRE